MSLLKLVKPAARYPADPRAVFILTLSVFSGITAFLIEATPQSLEATLPRWAVIAWSIVLVGGSALTLGGMARQTLNGILAEQLGSVTVGVASIFYSGLAMKVLGTDAIQIIAIIFAWGLACLYRWLQLQALINDAHHREKMTALEKIYAELEAAKQQKKHH